MSVYVGEKPDKYELLRRAVRLVERCEESEPPEDPVDLVKRVVAMMTTRQPEEE